MIAPIGTHPASYWHESQAFAERFAASPEAPRGPPHPVFPWVLGPEHAPGAAPLEPLDAVRARLAPKTDGDPPRCDGCGAVEHSGNAFCGPCTLHAHEDGARP